MVSAIYVGNCFSKPDNAHKALIHFGSQASKLLGLSQVELLVSWERYHTVSPLTRQNVKLLSVNNAIVCLLPHFKNLRVLRCLFHLKKQVISAGS